MKFTLTLLSCAAVASSQNATATKDSEQPQANMLQR